MTTCKECSFFVPVPEDAGDFKPGSGDCVTGKEDAKGKYWLSKPTTNASPSCQMFEDAQ